MRNELQDAVSSSSSMSWSDRWIGVPSLAICLLLAEAVVAALANLATAYTIFRCGYLDQWNLGHQVMLGVGASLLLVDLIFVLRWMLRRSGGRGFPVQLPARAASPVASENLSPSASRLRPAV